MGNNEQLGLDFEVEQTEWGKWVDPDRRAAQAHKFMDYAGLKGIPSKPWPEASPEVKRLDTVVAELFPNMATAMATENADMADAFICFVGECYVKFARAQWFDFQRGGRERSFYDHVNPALRWWFDDDDKDNEEMFTAWSLMDVITLASKFEEGFSSVASELRDSYARHARNITI
ncbi:hypothetical protein ACQPXH_27555 [Nocardia sp. CA-135953]|uniref:hypothetical protein n=1 Tax=Nocardia sp. CA-135953 TaxID=3239978 RepID=UPI003D973151